jgi:hypothetical protein
LKQHRRATVETLNDFAESTVKQLVKDRDWGATMKWLQQRHPEWTKKQLIEHMGTVGVVPGLLPKDEIAKMNSDVSLFMLGQ